MNQPIPVSLAFEDELTESLTLRIFEAIPTKYASRTTYNRGGSGYLKRTINGFNNAAKGIPFVVGTDLDDYACPPALLNDWLDHPKHHNLLMSIAVRESEAWVMADRQGFADLLGISVDRVPANVEMLGDPKQRLIELVSSSRKRELRNDICPRPGSTSKVGPNYNARLRAFVNNVWNLDAAKLNSPSLERTVDRLTSFHPVWA